MPLGHRTEPRRIFATIHDDYPYPYVSLSAGTVSLNCQTINEEVATITSRFEVVRLSGEASLRLQPKADHNVRREELAGVLSRLARRCGWLVHREDM
jgi:hypothetical protein